MIPWNPRAMLATLVSASKVFIHVACICALSGALCAASSTHAQQQVDATAGTPDTTASTPQEQAPPQGQAPATPEPSAASPSANVDSQDNVAAPAPAADIVAPNANIVPLQLLPLTPKHEGGMTSEEVAQHALTVSARARRAKAEAVRASGRAAQAYSLFLPRVDLKASYTRLSPVPVPSFSSLLGGPSTGGAATSGGSSINSFTGLNLLNRYSMQAAIRIPVSEYFVTLKDHYSSAQRMDQVSRLQKRGEVQAVIHEAKDYYINLARAIASRHLAEHRIEQLKRFTAEIQTLVESGELSQVELAQARAREASAEAALKSAIAAQNIAEDTLRAYLDMEPNAPIAINEPLLDTRPGPPAELAVLREHALRERPEMQALIELASAQMDTRDAVAGSRYPTLAFFGSLNYDNPNQRFIPYETKFHASWALGAELAWSPTELAVQNSKLDDAELDIARTREDIRALYARISIEVATAYENAIAAESAIAAAEAAVAAAQEALDARTALFHSGEATSRQVLDAELDLRVAQLDYIDNVLSTHLARAALDHAAGRASSND